MTQIFGHFSKVRQFISTEKHFGDGILRCYQYPVKGKIGIYRQIGVIGLAKSKKKKSLLGNISCQSFSKEYHLIPTFCVVIHDLLRDLQKIVSWTAEKNI